MSQNVVYSSYQHFTANAKICFIQPPYNVFMESLDAPFSLMYLAAVAEDLGWNATILDMKTLEDPIPEAHVYAVTSSSPQWPDAVKLGTKLAKQNPQSLRLVGGPHISAVPKNVYDTQYHAAVVGEGEQILESLLASFVRNGCTPTTNKIVYGRHTENLDTLPFPARHLIDWKRYRRGIFWGKHMIEPAVSIITSRGCPYNCCFCGSHVVFGRKTRFRSVANVCKEIEEVITKLGVKGFNFHDDTFCLSRIRTSDLCKAFMPYDISWRCLSRVDTVDKFLLGYMKASGCKEIILGVESGNQKVLDLLGKNVTVKENLRAMQMVKDAAIQLKVGVIVGSPGETWESVKDTKKMLKACPPDFWNVSVFTPFPGSNAWNHPEKYGLKILTRNLTQYAMVGKGFKGNVVCETEKMSKQDIEQARDELIDLCLKLSPV